MADTNTPNLDLVKPEVGASRDTWGEKTNANWDKVDSLVAIKGKANVFTLPQTMPNAKIDDAAGTYRNVEYRTSGVMRWVACVTNTTETGADSGSNFAVNRYSDSGTLLGSAISINRATGLVTAPDLQATNLNIGSADTTITRNAAGVLAVAGGVIPKENRGNTFSIAQTIDAGSNAGNPFLRIGGDSGMNRGVLFRTGTLNRWGVFGNSAAESSGNAGSDFQVARYDDAGTLISSSMIIERKTNNTTFYPNSDQTPASNVGHLVIRGSGYSGGLSLDTDGVWLSNNSASRAIILGPNNVERMRVNANGTVAIGTTNSSARLAIAATTASYNLDFLASTANGNNYIRFFDSTYATEYGRIQVNSGIFAINFGGADRIYMGNTGNIDFGNPSAAANAYFRVATSAGSAVTQTAHPTGTAANTQYANYSYAGTVIGSITQSGTTGVAYNTTSDYRLKENVVPLTDAIDRVMALKPSRFNFIADPSRTVDGFIAHEAQEVVPEAVTGEKDATRVITEDEATPELRAGTVVPDYQGIDQAKLVPLLTAALQDAITKINSLEARLAIVEGN